MAISKELKENSYGIGFLKAYFKVEDVRTKLDENLVIVYVRAYASKEARNKQKEIEKQREYYSKLSMGGDEFDKAFKNQTDYETEDDFRKFIEDQQEKYRQNIIGIYKNTFEISFNKLDIKEFTKDGIITAAYEYLKENIEETKGGTDC